MTSPVFTPFKLGGLTLRNRIVRSAAFEGMSPGGLSSPELEAYHRSVAAGGAALTTVAYASVSPDGLTYGHQLSLQKDGTVEALRRLTDAVHREGCAAAIQIGHAGSFAERTFTHARPIGPSRVPNLYALSVPRPMTKDDMDRVAGDFAAAVHLVREAGFDAVELQLCHGYLLSQFLSPYENRRGDAYGGSLENRMRFPLEVVRLVREAAGPDVPVLAKVNLRDGFSGGLEVDESARIARALESEGVDALILSGGYVSKVPMYVMRGDVPFAEMYEGQTRFIKKTGLLLFGRVMVKKFPFSEAYFLDDASRIRQAVKMPLSLVGGLRTIGTMERVVGEGFDLLSMARPLIMEPDLPRRLQSGEATGSRCEPCNRCIATMDKGGMRCTEI